jgi:hypothetical protein
MNTTVKQNDTPEKPVSRPILLSILCFIVFTYSGVLIIFFLAGIFNISWITKMLNEYSQGVLYSTTEIFFYSLMGFSIFSLMFFGAIKIWFLNKYGFYIFSISNFFIMAFQVFTSNYNWVAIIISALFILLLSFFYRLYR